MGFRSPLIHDILKIKYSDEGYLPYYPYHLISDEEMVDAFIFNESNFFDDRYPMPCDSLKDEYEELRGHIASEAEAFKTGKSDEIPDWVFSYMLGVVVCDQSSQKDVHDLLVLMNMDNVYDEFSDKVYMSLYKISKSALGAASAKRRNADSAVKDRPPTMFGEPHVIKYLRLHENGQQIYV